MAPVTETALRGLRKEFVDAIAYTTIRMPVDLTFNAASYGSDLDPDVQIFVRRAQAYRRAYTASEGNEKLIKGIMEMYEEEGNPAIIREGDLEEDGLKEKQIAGEPASKQRAWVRKHCKPRGPIGHLLESIHMQAASIDDEGTVWQNDRIPAQLLKPPLPTNRRDAPKHGHEEPYHGSSKLEEGV